MRALLCLIVLVAACGKNPSVDPANGSAGAAATSPSRKPGAGRLAMDHVTLLEPAEVIEERVDQEAFTPAFGRTMKEATSIVIAYDEAHSGVLPAELDVVLVARATGTRVWVVGANGDIAVPGLESSIASLPKLPIKEGNVAAAATLLRAGTASTERTPYLPAAWKVAAGSAGADIDQVIDKVWPR